MVPSFEPDKAVHSGKSHAECFSKSLQCESPCGIKDSSLLCLGSCELVPPNLFSTWLSSLFNFVLHIFSAVTNPKMGRVHAPRIVPSGAVVQHAPTFWNRTHVQNPRSPRGNHNLSVAAIDIPIPHVVSVSSPQPARVRFENFRPEPFWKRFGKTLRIQICQSNVHHSSVTNAVRVTGPAAFIVENGINWRGN